MKLVEFMNAHENWIELLSNAPYFIKVRKSGPYYLLKYDMLESDFAEPMVQEARGSIFTFDKEWKCVCHPMDKFFNYGEVYASDIDWETAKVYEKVDGSLMKLWYCDGWHLSTNGCVYAYEAEVSGSEMDYEDLFIKALHCRVGELLEVLDEDYTYYFELVSPYSRLVVAYPDTDLYYLGRRSIVTDKEDYEQREVLSGLGFKLPKVYPIDSLEGALMVAKEMTIDEEGFVVRDGQFRRIKVKGEEYLKAFHLRGNNVFSEKRVVEAMRGGYLDDMYGYCGDWKDRIDKVLKDLDHCAWVLDTMAMGIKEKEFKTQKDYAMEVKGYDRVYWDFLFKMRKSGVDGKAYLDGMDINKLVDFMKGVV